MAIDMAMERGGFRVVSDGESEWNIEDARAWCVPAPGSFDEEFLFVRPDAMPIRRIGRTELVQHYPPPEERLRGGESTLVFTQLGLFRPGDTLHVNGVSWDLGLWVVNTETTFRDLWREMNPIIEGGTPARRTGYSLIGIDFGARSITVSNTRVTAGMNVRRHLKRPPDPRAKPSRVPEKLQPRRLDGRRR